MTVTPAEFALAQLFYNVCPSDPDQSTDSQYWAANMQWIKVSLEHQGRERALLAAIAAIDVALANRPRWYQWRWRLSRKGLVQARQILITLNDSEDGLTRSA